MPPLQLRKAAAMPIIDRDAAAQVSLVRNRWSILIRRCSAEFTSAVFLMMLVAERRLQAFADLNLRVVNVRQHWARLHMSTRTGACFAARAKINFCLNAKIAARHRFPSLSSGKSMSGSGILYDLHSRRAHFTA